MGHWPALAALRARVLPRTLRWRLAAGVAVLMALSFGVALFAVYRGTGSAVSQQIDQELAGDAAALQSVLRGVADHTPAGLQSAAARYISGRPFTADSTLVFVQIPGARPVTNQPELLGAQRRPDSGETASEQARENSAGARVLGARAGYSTLGLADLGDLRLLRRLVSLSARGTGATGTAGARHDRDDARLVAAKSARSETSAVWIGVGEPLISVARAQRGVLRAFVLAGILVLVGALLGAYLIGTRFSAPLRRMAAVASRVDGGDLHPRIHDLGERAAEVRVLAESFNHMLDRLTEAFAGQRAFVADASHELRTPLTVMRGQIELLLAQEDPPREELERVGALVQAEIGRMARLVDDLLLLAKSERPELLETTEVDLKSFIEDLWAGIGALGERRAELAEVPPGRLLADPDRLAQALRNLLSNAVQHTEAPGGLVRLSMLVRGREVEFMVDDDGPGIPQDQREQVFGRFHRTDSGRGRAAGGAGLGLAIVRAIADAHGGSVRAEASPQGGARVVLRLPHFTPLPAVGQQRRPPAPAAGPARSR
ncbi:MAG: HAMP domain-containing protein [Acidobacteriota bacterium]|nr:HAMP domain-containing protein [Acidobacteriota bacterium]